jgi:hypothetical protein
MFEDCIRSTKQEMTMNPPTRPRRILIAMLAIGCALCAVLGLWSLSDTLQFRFSAQTAEGVVTAIERSSPPSVEASVSTVPVVRFMADGQTVEIRGQALSEPPELRVGDKVTVFFPPGRPEDGRIGTFLQQFSSALWYLVSALVLAGLWVLARRLPGRQRPPVGDEAGES